MRPPMTSDRLSELQVRFSMYTNLPSSELGELLAEVDRLRAELVATKAQWFDAEKGIEGHIRNRDYQVRVEMALRADLVLATAVCEAVHRYHFRETVDTGPYRDVAKALDAWRAGRTKNDGDQP